MNWRPALLISSIALLVLGGVAYVAINFGTRVMDFAQGPTASSSPSIVTFSETGTLTRNNPGHVPGTWYLTYEKLGTPGLSVPLAFSSTSRCGVSATSSFCGSFQLDQGLRTHVTGTETNSIVQVQRLTATTTNPSQEMILLYFYNPALDTDAQGQVRCSQRGLVAVPTIIPRTNAPIVDAVRTLLSGNLPPEGSARGITTEYPLPGFSLASTSLRAGTLTLAFIDPQHQASGGACRTRILRFQIEATARQFSQVQQVRLTPSTLFQP
ncbi:MAG: hypothetical protein B7X04_04185 [Parcubacteria group bacterium 21-54-25]|nr:MAG: hypothetical protein B7X04_04185 [Parcubacteria group bacterium 21-54-25]HQU08234.1 hypothetical protein [Candidatus Paceibacterota bacterium]